MIPELDETEVKTLDEMSPILMKVKTSRLKNPTKEHTISDGSKYMTTKGEDLQRGPQLRYISPSICPTGRTDYRQPR